jgi:RNA-dependent RNA polymerase
MNICIWDVNFQSNHWDVKKAIASVVHYEDEFKPSKYGARRLNFKVELNWVQEYVRNDGTGSLILPSREVRLL